VNTHVNKSAARTFTVACLLVGTCLVACSSTDDGTQPIIPGGVSGSTQAGGGAGGSAAGASAGGSAQSGNGAGGSAGSGAGTAGTSTAGAGGTSGCIGNMVNDQGVCKCPTYAPDFCPAVMKCSNQTKDPDHCGGCDTKCAATSACSAGMCTAEPTSVGEVAGCGELKLQLGGGKLYLLSTDTLKSMPIPAGGAPTDVATGLTMGSAFVVDATYAYVAAGTSLLRVKLSDGTKNTVVTEAKQIYDVAVVGDTLYYASGPDVKSIASTASAGTGTSVAVGVDSGEPQGVAVSGGFVLYGSSVAFNVEADPIAPGEGHLKLGASQGGMLFGHRSVQADADYVYWAINSTVQRAPFTGVMHSQKTAGQALNNVTAYAINATTAYFASEMGDLEKAAFGDEKSTWMARGLDKVTSLVLDDQNVYLATDKCKILKTAL
jgi:hypothetical protein